MKATRARTKVAKKTSANGAAGNEPARPREPRRDREVLDAAVKVFSARGYADASVQDIADELGILKGSLYYYINSKEDLLFRLLEEVHADVQAILEDVLKLDDDDDDPVHRLCEYFTRQAEYLTRNVARMAIYYHDIDQLSPDHQKLLVRQRRVHERFVIRMIEEAQAQGVVPADVDPVLTMNYLFGSMIHMFRWYTAEGKFKSAPISKTLRTFVARSVGAAA